MDERFSRTCMLIGEDALQKLQKSRVAVFGVGGVGGYVAEALGRSGVGSIELVDNDTVNLSNVNRQIIALTSTVGRYKTDVMRERLLDINGQISVAVRNEFFLPENSHLFDFSQYDYVVDAIDTVSGKIELAVQCKKVGTPLISCMGAGNKLDPTAFRVTDIYKTDTCPLARVMRTQLRKRGVKKLKVVYSTEQAIKPAETEEQSGKRQTPGSLAFVPSVAGLICASEVIKDLIK